jgi:dnd system-associated protein 4
MKKDLFTKEVTVFWPEKHDPIVDFLKNGTHGAAEDALYKFNVDVIVLAACIGLLTNTKCPVGDRKKEIALSTFNGQSLSSYLYLIPLMASDEVDLSLLRNEEGEQRTISIFQEYAAGGLQYLSEEYEQSGLKTPFVFIRELIDKIKSIQISDGNTLHEQSSNIIDLKISLFGNME